MDIFTSIDEIIVYAKDKLMLDELDVDIARNGILAVVGLETYRAGNPDVEKAEAEETPDRLLRAFTDACVKSGLIEKEKAESVGAAVMETVSLKPSQLNDMYFGAGGADSRKAREFLADYVKASGFGKSSNPAFVEETTDDGVCVKATGEGKDELIGVYLAIDELIAYAQNNLLLDEYDTDYARRAVCNILGIDSYAPQEIDNEKVDALDRPDLLIGALTDVAGGLGIIDPMNAPAVADRVMSALSLRPSEINDIFDSLGGKKATDFLYDYCVKNYYVKKTALERNIRFKSGYTRLGLEITINKARPEYKDASSAAAGNTPSGGYPECTICPENEGFVGTGKCALRKADIELGGESWFWQYSPYGYIGKHGIAVSSEHKPMCVDDKTVVRLMDFVDKFPHFFIGCNAALPGAGGSVLSHEHFQGGEEMLPIHRAEGKIKLTYPKYPLADIEVLDWYASVIRVTSQSRQVLSEIEKAIREGWENYSDETRGIIAEDKDGKHNAVSLTMRKISNGRYCLDVTLRSNVKSKKYPDGVFHTHPEFSALKKEANGLLEAQGYFILPGRIEEQMKTLSDCLVNKQPLPDDMKDFALIYDEIVRDNGREMSKVDAGIYIKEEFGSVCERILGNIAVFKTPEETADFLAGLGSFKKN